MISFAALRGRKLSGIQWTPCGHSAIFELWPIAPLTALGGLRRLITFKSRLAAQATMSNHRSMRPAERGALLALAPMLRALTESLGLSVLVLLFFARPCTHKIRPNVCFSPKATELPRGSEMMRCAIGDMASVYSITSSAMTSSFSGTSRPSALAVRLRCVTISGN